MKPWRRIWCRQCGRYVRRWATRYFWIRHIDRRHGGFAAMALDRKEHE
jgi:hypothetical protein